MSETGIMIDYGPLVIIGAALLWGLGRILYLGYRKEVTVLSFLTRRKTAAEHGLAVIALVLDGYLILRPFVPALDGWVYAQPSAFPVFALIVMALGIGLMVVSQINMGKAWRIGVPSELEGSQSLVTSGVYAFSRNPIYVAILMFLTGAAILHPGPLTVAAVLGTYMLLRPVIKSEEAFMEAAFGDKFRHYKSHVRRWI